MSMLSPVIGQFESTCHFPEPGKSATSLAHIYGIRALHGRANGYTR